MTETDTKIATTVELAPGQHATITLHITDAPGCPASWELASAAMPRLLAGLTAQTTAPAVAPTPEPERVPDVIPVLDRIEQAVAPTPEPEPEPEQAPAATPDKWAVGDVVPWDGVLSRVVKVRQSEKQQKGWALLECGIKVLYSMETGEVLDTKIETPPAGRTLRELVVSAMDQGVTRDNLAAWCETQRANEPVVASIRAEALPERVERVLVSL